MCSAVTAAVLFACLMPPATLAQDEWAMQGAAVQVEAPTGFVSPVPPQSQDALQRAVAREAARAHLEPSRASSLRAFQQQTGHQEENFVRRHPKLFGALVGFGGGFLVGYLPGDDGVFDDYVAEFNGLVVGGIGAGVGSIVGAVFDK